MTDILIHSDRIKLDSFLKWAGLVSTGGEAKRWIADGRVRVNGEVETRRGKQLSDRDVVAVEGIGEFVVKVAGI